MKKYKFEISIETQNELTEEVLYETLYTIKSRIEGYHTEPIKELENSSWRVRYVDIRDERKKKLEKINEK